MTPKGTSSVNFDVKSPASVFFQDFMVKTNFPKEGHAELEIDNVAGTGKRRKRYKMSRFQITKEWYKTIRESVPSDKVWQNPDCFKTLEGTMTVIVKEDGNGAHGVWTVDYEKTRGDLDDPRFITNTCVKFFKVMDENLTS
ncbi:PREDICTED: uncharacterized protein At1g24010-like [Camelina sativa]|uniref:Uncharacterized protein At1g24010-like n=1 Tax=Camelina sativa TaxID=90675 RepID=A0ABM0YCF2_CAMSA|nr:PREDICTED: uncharacterized protein At1g24010-like [Camelina sativa]